MVSSRYEKIEMIPHSGQGLSASYYIISENHGGHLNVESSGAGTSFIIDLPLHGKVKTGKL